MVVLAAFDLDVLLEQLPVAALRNAVTALRWASSIGLIVASIVGLKLVT